MNYCLEELVDFSSTAAWRRAKAQEYPDDARNLVAAEKLIALEKQAAALRGSDIHRRIETALITPIVPTESFDESDLMQKQDEVISDHLRYVGFGYDPDATKFFTDLAEGLELARECKSRY